MGGNTRWLCMFFWGSFASLFSSAFLRLVKCCTNVDALSVLGPIDAGCYRILCAVWQLLVLLGLICGVPPYGLGWAVWCPKHGGGPLGFWLCHCRWLRCFIQISAEGNFFRGFCNNNWARGSLAFWCGLGISVVLSRSGITSRRGAGPERGDDHQSGRGCWGADGGI